MISVGYGKAKKCTFYHRFLKELNAVNRSPIHPVCRAKQYLLLPLVFRWQHLFPPESSNVKGIIKQRLFWGIEESWRFTANMLFFGKVIWTWNTAVACLLIILFIYDGYC